jgi:hypothetical protein
MLMLPKIDRRRWLAWWAQERRRKRGQRLPPAPVLRAMYPDQLAWDWDGANPFKWNIWLSLNSGASWVLIEDYWTYGAARQFAPDGGGEWYYIVGVDAGGVEITGHSNVIRPADAPEPWLRLLRYYPLNDLADAAGNADLTGYDDPTFGPGLMGDAFLSDGVATLSGGDLDFSALVSFSVNLWVNFPADIGQNAQFFCLGEYGLESFIFYVLGEPEVNANLYLFTPGNNWNDWVPFAAAPAVNFAAWNMLTIVFDGQWKIYFNGADVGLPFDDVPLTAGPLPLNLGGHPYGPDYAAGPPLITDWQTPGLDELGVWRGALTPTQIAWLYNAGAGRSYDDQIFLPQ